MFGLMESQSDSMSRVLREAGVCGQDGPVTDLTICRGGAGMIG